MYIYIYIYIYISWYIYTSWYRCEENGVYSTDSVTHVVIFIYRKKKIILFVSNRIEKCITFLIFLNVEK